MFSRAMHTKSIPFASQESVGESYEKALLHLSESLTLPPPSHQEAPVTHEGRISRIGMVPGVLYVVENENRRTYGINLSALEGYCGETLEELGFQVGAAIRFDTIGEQQVVAAKTLTR